MEDKVVKFVPFRELILVENVEKGKEIAFPSLIEMPENFQLNDKTQQVRVLAVGPKVENPMIKPGLIILINKLGETSIRIGKEFKRIIHENEILGSIEWVENQVVVNHG